MEQREAVWGQVQRQYAAYLSDWRADLGGKDNFHNGTGGTYDCIALMSYYVVCKAVTGLAEIEEMECALFLPAFRKLRFVDCNKPFWRKLMHRAFLSSKRGCDRWGDYKMSVAPYENNKPLSATRTTPLWSCCTQGWCGQRPVPTAASVTTPSAEIRTNI